MKYLIIIFSLLIVSGCGNCDHCDDQPVIYDYTFLNNSGFTLEIVPFDNGLPNYSKKVTVPNNAKIQKQYKDGAPYDGYNMGVLLFEANVYELDIVFNNQKKVHYKSCSDTNDCNADPRNIFNNLNNGVGTKIYTVTPDDYQNAGSCSGNCY
ncbi:hypothetical protein NZ698_09335 [Chryseobacterium sp. PBS4-4]|uniref:Lipoprotein n=1 Tax=Chryseobacterium edaphi TaxID=2976532 RepID=A0ABT2W5W5_9FLAO|nr:hypothetical protein [Chryseobacterium edaphi]MCU7617400.1 hypothetical protein [Chryseobacterium edaphi]